MKRLIPAIVGALFFAALGPFIAALVTILARLLAGDGFAADSGQQLASAVGVTFLVAYMVGIVPAFLSGFIACALLPRIKSLPAFLGVCVLAEVVASAPIAYAVARFFENFGPNRDVMDALLAWLVLGVLGLVPALLLGGAVWYRRRSREQPARNQPGTDQPERDQPAAWR